MSINYESNNFNEIRKILANIQQASQINDDDLVHLENETKNFLISTSKNFSCKNEFTITMSQKELEEFIKLSVDDKNLSLILIILLEKNFFESTINILDRIFIDNYITYKFFKNVLTEFYKNNTQDKYIIPSQDKIINLIFKLPDRLANLMRKNIINKTEYFLLIFQKFLKKENEIFYEEFLEKIFKLKMTKILIIVLTRNKNENKYNCSIDYTTLYEKIKCSIYYEDFLEILFLTKVENESEWKNLFFFYKNLSIDQNFSDNFKGEIIKILSKNYNILSFILLSNNEALLCFYLKEIFENLKNKVEEMDCFIFYLILFSLFHVLENEKEKAIDKIIENIFKLLGCILEKLIDRNKIKTFQLFTEYFQTKIFKIIEKSFEKGKDKLISEKIEEHKLTEEEKEILNFLILKENIIKNPLDCLNKFRKQFDEKFLKLKKESKSAEIDHINSKLLESSSKSIKKTKLLSIKFKKKYGEYNPINKNSLLEFNKDPDELFEIKGLQLNKSSIGLKIKLEKEDDFSDLQTLSKPQYLKDCLLGLNSEFPDRQELSLKSLPDLISDRPLDLNFFLPQIADCLLKLNNNFELENFDDIVENILIKLTEYDPVKMTHVMCNRFFVEESGFKQKFQILNVIEKSCENISNYHSINKKTPQSNKMHVFLENIIFPLLNNLNSKNIDYLIFIEEFDYLLAKFLDVISKIIKYSENHPFIYKTLFESMHLFKAIVNNKAMKVNKSIVLLNSLNFFAYVLNKFLNVGFLEIYPEFMQNFKFILQFLNDTVENVENEEAKIEIIKNMNNMLINLEKIKEKWSKNLSMGINDILII